MDLLIFIIATVVAVLSTMYYYALSQVAFLKANWPEYRCNPIFMPMAGLVGQDVFTNFTKCTMKNFSDYTGYVMDPIMSEFNTVNSTLGEIGGAMNSMRGMMSSVRGGFTGIIGTVFGKIQNLMSQFQYTAIRLRTVIGRITGVMMSFVMIFYTGMQTGESINNGPIMGTMRFLCFSPKTLIKTDKAKEYIQLKDVKLGQKLHKNSVVTSIYQIDGRGVPMYTLHNVTVSGSHKVLFNGSFIAVKDHPNAKKTDSLDVLFCLNTSTHRVYTATSEYLDFIESEDPQFTRFKREYIELAYNKELRLGHQPLTSTTGVSCDTRIPLQSGMKTIQTIQIGDILQNGDAVKGIVKHRLSNSIVSSLDTQSYSSQTTWIVYNDTIVPMGSLATQVYIPNAVVYQLITESSMFPIVTEDDRTIMILDELETTEKEYHRLKDAIITSGRFRGKEIVV
jgi:hypothetical protein